MKLLQNFDRKPTSKDYFKNVGLNGRTDLKRVRNARVVKMLKSPSPEKESFFRQNRVVQRKIWWQS